MCVQLFAACVFFFSGTNPFTCFGFRVYVLIYGIPALRTSRPAKYPDTLTMGARNQLVDASRGEFLQHYAVRACACLRASASASALHVCFCGCVCICVLQYPSWWQRCPLHGMAINRGGHAVGGVNAAR